MNTRSKASLFMLELIVVIAVFSVSSAICLRIFFRSHEMTIESRNLSHASIEVQSAADCYKSAKGRIKTAANLLGGKIDQSGVMCIYYDDLWKRVDMSENASFRLSITEFEPGYGKVKAEKTDGTPIFSINVRGDFSIE